MRPEARKFLFDIQKAAELITEFVKGKSREDFAKDPLLRSAVERQPSTGASSPSATS
jgi:uncharacterized protein with HEPN domain